MDIVEYENGLPKGYLARRRKADLIYIISVYVYGAMSLMLEYGIVSVADNLMTLINGALILLSCGCLCYSAMARKNYKGLVMHNHHEIKAFSVKEKWLLALPVIAFTVFVPLKMLVYSLFAGCVLPGNQIMTSSCYVIIFSMRTACFRLPAYRTRFCFGAGNTARLEC